MNDTLYQGEALEMFESMLEHIQNFPGNEKDKAQLLQLILPTVLIEVEQVGLKAAATIGASRMGGAADVPTGFEWPSWKGEPLAFIAQLNCAELPRLPGYEGLPTTGLLSFFYAGKQQPWGFDPADKGSSRTYYFPATETLQTKAGSGVNFKQASISFSLFPSFSDSYELYPKFVNEKTTNKWYEMLNDIIDATDETNKLGGYPDLVQYSMEGEVALAANGVFAGDGEKSLKNPDSAKFLAQAPEWKLLLQVASVGALGMEWGDVGNIYFWIHQQDLAAGNFENVWTILQCT
jgi:uncharacterized protein YwqG